MALVFISHSSKDNQKAVEFKNILEQNGIKSPPFLDIDEKTGIKIGEDWEKKLYKELKKCHIVVLLLSPNWLASKWCFAEYAFARDLGKEIMPIIIKQGKDNQVDKAISSNIQYSDITTTNPSAIKNIIERIKELSLETQRGFEWDINRDPYPGLKLFEVEDGAIFFGREKETKEIIEKLNSMKTKNTTKILNIVATSGIGKSSLLKAGVIATLKLTYSKDWLITSVIKPSEKPLKILSKTLANTVLQDYTKAKKIYENLKTDNYKKTIDDISVDFEFLEETHSQKAILLPIDQAEEFFTTEPNDDLKYFIRALEYLFTIDEKIISIWTMRSDFLKYHQTSELTKNLREKENIYTISPIPKTKISDIIKKPAEVVGIRVEEKLIERIKEDFKNKEALPLLAMTLQELYTKAKESKKDEISLNDYKTLSENSTNPIATIIKTKINEVIKKLSKEEIKELKGVFIPHLVGISENEEFIKKSADISVFSEKTNNIIEFFVEARLLIKSENKISIAHEALLREWDMLYMWLQEEKEFLLFEKRLKIFYNEWIKVNKDKKALLSGLSLENAIKFKDKFNSNMHDYIDKSKEYDTKKKNELEHSIAIAKVQTANFYVSKKMFAHANIFAFDTLEQLISKKIFSTVKQKAKRIVCQNQLYYLPKTFKGHNEFITNLVVSKNSNYIISCSEDKTIKMWDLESGNLINTLEGHENYVLDVLITKDSKKIISCSRDKTIKIWDLESGKVLNTIKGHKKSIHCIALLPDEKKIVSGSEDKTIKIWDLESGKVLNTIKGHNSNVYSLDVIPNGKKIISGSRDNIIKIWDIKSGKVLITLNKHEDSIACVIAIDNTKFASSSYDKTIKIWDIESGEVLNTLDDHDGIVYDIAITSDKRKLISCSEDKTIKIWDIENNKNKLLHTLESHKDNVKCIDVASNGDKIVSASDDKTIKIWDIVYGEDTKEHKGHVLSVDVTSDGSKVVSCSEDKTIKIWDLKSGEVLNTIEGHNKSVRCITVIHDENKIVSASEDKTIKIWDLESGNLINTLEGHTNIVLTIAINTKRKKIISGSKDETVRIWELESGDLLRTLEGHNGSIYGVCVIDDKRIASCSRDSTIKIWELESGKLINTLEGHNDYVRCIATTRDKTKIISGSDDKTVRIWDIESGKLINTLEGHENWVISVAITEKKIISSSWDKTIKIWDLESGKLINTLEGHEKSVRDITITPNCKKIISCSNDKTIKIWDIEKAMFDKTLEFYEVCTENENKLVLEDIESIKFKKETIKKSMGLCIINSVELKNK